MTHARPDKDRLDRADRGRGTTEHRVDAVVRQLSQLTKALPSDQDTTQTLQAIIDLARLNITAAHHVCITLVSDSHERATTVASDDLVGQLDLSQFDRDEGPAPAALRQRTMVRADDLHHDIRWPAFSSRVEQVALASALSFPLYDRTGDFGAMTIYSARPNAFADTDEAIGTLLTNHIVVAWAWMKKHVKFEAALLNRDVIGQAKGILMERHKISPEVAFAMLVDASNQRQRKLVDVAQFVAETGQEPGNMTRLGHARWSQPEAPMPRRERTIRMADPRTG